MWREEHCLILWYHAWSRAISAGQGHPRLSATFALRWSHVIEHDITCGTAFFSPWISGMVLFLSRVVNSVLVVSRVSVLLRNDLALFLSPPPPSLSLFPSIFSFVVLDRKAALKSPGKLMRNLLAVRQRSALCVKHWMPQKRVLRSNG